MAVVLSAAAHEHKNQHNREYMRNKRSRRSAADLCVECGGHRSGGGSRCADCNARRRAQYAGEDKVCKRCRTRDRYGRRVLCRECTDSTRRYQTKLKYEVLSAYGGKCACCGERDARFLTLDHINNDGAEEKRSLSPSGKRSFGIYNYLKRGGFPVGRYQVLCWNCNSAKRVDGVCPHTLGEPVYLEAKVL
jgi:hypothetical protein